MNHTSKPVSMRVFRAIACIAACLPLMLGGAGGLVLCLGQGGHFAIEPFHEGSHHSHENHREEHQGQHHSVISHEGCDSCFDIPITVDEAAHLPFGKEIKRMADISAFDPARSTHAEAIPTHRNSSFSSYHPPLTLPDYLEGLRTTVLRT